MRECLASGFPDIGNSCNVRLGKMLGKENHARQDRCSRDQGGTLIRDLRGSLGVIEGLLKYIGTIYCGCGKRNLLC